MAEAYSAGDVDEISVNREVSRSETAEEIEVDMECSDIIHPELEEEEEMEIGMAITGKRLHEDENSSEDGGRWNIVARSRKLVRRSSKEVEELIKVIVSCSTGLPKQFALARLFKDNNINGVTQVKFIHQYKIVVTLNKETDADLFIQCKAFKDLGWKCQKNTEVGVSYGLIRDIDLDVKEEDIIKNLTCSAEIVSAKRLNKRNYKEDETEGWIKCEAVRLAFKGPSLPAEVFIYGMKVKIFPYVFPVTQCSRCWKYGHTRLLCPSKKPVCPKCTKSHENCETTQFRCVNCAGAHMSLQKICPIFKKERRIRELMSEFNCTYRKALTLYVPPSPIPERAISPGPPLPQISSINRGSEEDPIISVEEKRPAPQNLTSSDQTQNKPIQSRRSKRARKQTPLPSPSSSPNTSRAPVQRMDFAPSPAPVIKPCLRRPTVASSTPMETERNKDSDDYSDSDETEIKKLSFIQLIVKLYKIVVGKGKLEGKIQEVFKICLEWTIPKVMSIISAGSLANILSNYGL